MRKRKGIRVHIRVGEVTIEPLRKREATRKPDRKPEDPDDYYFMI
jgi:hypothetical protein